MSSRSTVEARETTHYAHTAVQFAHNFIVLKYENKYERSRNERSNGVREKSIDL